MEKSGCESGATTTTSRVMLATTGAFPAQVGAREQALARQYLDRQHLVVRAVVFAADPIATNNAQAAPRGRARSLRARRTSR